ncbi:MAG: L-lactate permease [Desulfobacterales bacterium]|nr:L-lactate permease [Desulfobacterales bacterium]MDJ0912450.1 L-lactate permease [Desulfobacterales bacterium]
MSTYLDFFMALLPLVILIWMMTKKNSVPSNVALPLAALMVYALKLVYFGSDPNLMNATVVKGALEALTPISIIWGAIILFKTMDLSGQQAVVNRWLNQVSSNRVAQLMLIGWAFAFMIEGASGFGTPAAIAGPILVGLGFEVLPVAMLALVMNSVPVSFGAVGTPTWYGFGQLGLDADQLLTIGAQTAIIHAAAAFIIPVMALRFVVSWREIRANLVFVYLSILACVVPYVLLAQFNNEFPALVAGAIGFAVSVVLARANIGLQTSAEKSETGQVEAPVEARDLIRALSPFMGLIAILVVTRIPALPFRGLMGAVEPTWGIELGSFGSASLSAALVIKLTEIFGTKVAWVYKALFVPALIPFFLIYAVSIPVLGISGKVARQIWTESLGRIRKTVVTLVGALIMVQLGMVGGDNALTAVIGRTFAEVTGAYWQYFAAYLGAVGSFFSGSATVSNLTFGGIQEAIAASVGLNKTLILALQSVGGAMGNMVCINNIVAVCMILGVYNQEGAIIKKTVVPMFIYGVIAALMSVVMALFL